MSYRILGPLHAHGPRGPVLLTSPAQRALLAALLADPGRTVTAGRLAGEPAATVRALARAFDRAGAAAVLVHDAARCRLDARPEEIDAGRFAARADAARRALAAGDCRAAAEETEAALTEWGGPPLAEFAGEPFAARVVADLEYRHAQVVQDRAEARLALGDVGWCVTELAGLVREMPYRERLWELYATALDRAGRRADALAAVRQVRDLLDEELGLPPGPGLTALEQSLGQSSKSTPTA